MTFLLTGATGYLGKKLFSQLRARGDDVVAVSRQGEEGIAGCDLMSLPSVERLVSSVPPDCIIHCAAQVPRNLDEFQDVSIASSNIAMMNNILRATTCPVIYVSSMTVYGEAPNSPVNERAKCTPTTEYAASKLSCEWLMENLSRRGLAIRIPGLFGYPRRAGLVHNLISAAVTQTELTLPQNRLQWSGCHVDEVVRAIIQLLPAAKNRFSAVNFGCHGSVSINKLVSIVNEIYGSDLKCTTRHPEFEFDLTRYRSLSALKVPDLADCIERFGNELFA